MLNKLRMDSRTQKSHLNSKKVYRIHQNLHPTPHRRTPWSNWSAVWTPKMRKFFTFHNPALGHGSISWWGSRRVNSSIPSVNGTTTWRSRVAPFSFHWKMKHVDQWLGCFWGCIHYGKLELKENVWKQCILYSLLSLRHVTFKKEMLLTLQRSM